MPHGERGGRRSEVGPQQRETSAACAAGRTVTAAGLGLVAALAACGRPAGSAPTSARAPSMVSVSVPLVGCADDGQVGPQTPPANGTKTVLADRAAAPQLAYYVTANGPGVLAPRGWHCAGIYGSDGASLVVTPEPEFSLQIFRTADGMARPGTPSRPGSPTAARRAGLRWRGSSSAYFPRTKPSFRASSMRASSRHRAFQPDRTRRTR